MPGAQPADPNGTPEGARAELARTRAQGAEATARAERLEAAAAAASDDAARVEARAAALAARIQAAEADIAQAEARIALIETLRRDQRARLAAEQGPAVRLAAAAQLLGLRPAATALVEPGSIDDLVHVRAVLATVGAAIDGRTAGLRAEVARGIALRDAAGRALAALDAGRAALVTQRAQLAALAGERRKAADRLAGSAMIEQDRAMAMGEEARDIGTLMARMDAAAGVRARLETLEGPRLRPADPNAAASPPTERGDGGGQAPYRLPAIGSIVTGMGEVSEAGVRARGLTLATAANAQVVAPTGGRIVYAAPYRGYGQIVIIDHGRGWTTLITGLAALDTRAGDTVSQGSPIGRAGPARPTITVELRRNGTPMDITRLIG